MTRMAWPALLAATTLIGCAQPTPEQQIVNDAAQALGGRDRILAVKTLVIEGEGTSVPQLGQDMTPEATSQNFRVTGYRRLVDVAADRARVEQTRTPNFAYFQGPAPQKQVAGVDGSVGYNVAANGNAARIPNAAAKDRRAEIYHHPITIVRAALDPAAKLANPRTGSNQSIVDVTAATGLTFTLAIDSTTKLPTRVVSMVDHPNLGDVANETSFADYQAVGALQLPTRFATKTDKYATGEIRVTRQSVDGEVGDLAAPAAAASAAPIEGPPPANVTVEEVDKGIWFLAGQGAHSVLVEFTDHLMLIEAPGNDTRTLAVIAKARTIKPDKPLTHVVTTHHHYDHTGGLRAAVSEGLTVITHKGNAAHYEELMGKPHTIAPDALAKHPKALKIEAVEDGHIIKDAAMAVHLYEVQNNGHSDTMLMAYFPRERVLVEADVYSPGREIAPYAASLLENITKRNLRVDRIVPIHGTIVPNATFLKEARAATTN